MIEGTRREGTRTIAGEREGRLGNARACRTNLADAQQGICTFILHPRRLQLLQGEHVSALAFACASRRALLTGSAHPPYRGYISARMHALRCTLQIVTDLLRMELRLRVHRLAVDARSWRAKESVSGVSTPSVTPTHGRWCSPFRAHAAPQIPGGNWKGRPVAGSMSCEMSIGCPAHGQCASWPPRVRARAGVRSRGSGRACTCVRRPGETQRHHRLGNGARPP